MEVNFIQTKPFDESIGLSVCIDLYNQMIKYLNPDATIELTEELVRVILGKETDLSQSFLIFENQQEEIIAFAGILKSPMFKGAWMAFYGILPEYFKSELPGKVIDATLDLGEKQNPPELLFQTIGDLSAPFDEKLKFLGFKPIHYSWSMYLDDLSLFSHPGIPKGITIQIQKEIDDYSTCVAIINKAFEGSFKFKPIRERKWKKIRAEFKKNHIVEYCIAYENNKMIGFCDAFINPKQENIGLIADLSVPPNYQHRKIGSALLATGIETLLEKGCKTINLSVHAENEKAMGLYKKFGFYPKNNLTEKIYQII